MATWIFQGNPDNFKVDTYIRDYLRLNKQISWTIRQKRFTESIKLGDVVFIWRSLGRKRSTGSSGIIARTVVKEEAFSRKDDEDAIRYWENKEDANEMQPRVRLEILEEKTLGGHILKERLTEHPLLNELDIFKMRNNTNYELINAHASALFELWEQQIRKNNDLPFPEPKKRVREYNKYSRDLRSEILFQYLFNAMTHREMDRLILGLDSGKSKGYQSMGILHYLGLRDQYQGIFKGLELFEAIEVIRSEQSENPEVSQLFNAIIDVLTKGEIQYPLEVTPVLNSTLNEEWEDDEGKGYAEGRIKFRLHKKRERNTTIVKKAKQKFMRDNGGRLFCEVCKIDFSQIYGERGKEFIECHHKKPVSLMNDGEETLIEDLAMLCANCHRMIHRSPLISIEELKDSVKVNNGLF